MINPDRWLLTCICLLGVSTISKESTLLGSSCYGTRLYQNLSCYHRWWIPQPLLPVPPPPMPTVEPFPPLPGKTSSVPDSQSPDIHHLSSLKGKKKMTLPPATSPSRPPEAVPPFIQWKVKKERKHIWWIGDMTPLDKWVNRYDILSHKESFTQSSWK